MAGAPVAWRQFSFFDLSNGRPGELPDDAVCSTSGRDCVYMGCSDGRVAVIDGTHQLATSFQAHAHRVDFISRSQASNMLFTVAGRDGHDGCQLRCWTVNAAQPAVAPTPAGPRESIPLSTAKLPLPADVTTVAVHASAWPVLVVAAGLANGKVYLLRGDAEKDRLSRAVVDAQPPGAAPSPVTGLHIIDGATGPVLYVVTGKHTSVIDLNTNQLTKLDDAGCAPGCSAVDESKNLVVARPDAVYFYSTDGRGPCFVHDGAKKLVTWVRHYLVAVSALGRLVAAASGSSSPLAAPSPAAAEVVEVFDLRNKLVAGRAEVEAGVAAVLPAWGGVAALTADHRVVLLRERELAHKLDSLFAKGLYSVALNVAEADQADEGTLADIHRRAGDALHAKHDFAGAVAEYCLTIGQLEPSFVIRRFLDAQRIHNLTSYLEALHTRGLATADHTTLLLNCYTKLKDVAKLDGFLHRGGSAEGGSPALNFDVDTAIKVLRGAGYFDHALFVAQAAGEAGWYLDILLEDCGSYDAALAYLQGLTREEAGAALKKHGKVLVTHRPEATTALLMQLCTPGERDSDWVTQVADFAHIYSERPMALMLLCEFILNSQPAPPGEPFLLRTLLELYLADALPDDAAGGGGGDDAVTRVPAASTKVRREQAMELLKRGWPAGEEARYDADAVLVLCRMRDFRDGLLFLYERMRLFREVMQVCGKLHMAAGDHAALIETCVRLGDAAAGGDAQLWTQALQYFGSQQTDCTQQVKEIIRHLEARQLLPPLVVLQELARNRSLPLGVVRDYVARQLAAESAAVKADRAQIAKLEAETKALRLETTELRTKARVFQSSKCALTGAPLELPAVHFLCGHAFNLRSLGENDRDCPLCAPQFRAILDIRNSLRAGAAEQGKFFNQLKHSADGFGVVADYFGRGIMNKTSVSTDQ